MAPEGMVAASVAAGMVVAGTVEGRVVVAPPVEVEMAAAC